jgi:mannose-1-phosphate guanylyltransferase
MHPRLWSVVLAAGKGRRLWPLTAGIPKQFWRPTGTGSLLDETLTRLAPLSSADRTVIVVDAAHREYIGAQPAYRERGHVLFQPTDRGTAAGVWFGLTPILAEDPDAVVLLTPSDHGIGDEAAFRRGISDAAASVRSSDGVVLLGVEPSAASGDLGWISLTSAGRPGSICPVTGFVEKPHPTLARRLRASGAVWNTMVLVARARDLVALSEAHLPEVTTTTFLRAAAEPARSRHAFFQALYPLLPTADFSRDVLTKSRGLRAYTWPSSVGWSDLGTPERLCAWLRATPPAPASPSYRSGHHEHAAVDEDAGVVGAGAERLAGLSASPHDALGRTAGLDRRWAQRHDLESHDLRARDRKQLRIRRGPEEGRVLIEIGS